MFTKFNQVLLASGLVIGSAVMLSPAAFAQTSDGGEVTGNIAAVQTVDFIPQVSVAVTANLANQTLPFGTLEAESNVTWDMEVKSANAGLLEHIDDPTQTISYELEVAQVTDLGTSAGFVTFINPNTDYPVYDGGTNSTGLTTTNVNLKLGNTTSKKAGNYTDNITFTISPR
ncbi:hypothetical protein [Synechocystis salina]|uniref:hypothetical protein n=1 Tax=Synechocystis salina TaxID=945780 RepID=UPI00187F59EF|nr:hypothetical protein [Synechocystis salina]MBE9241908.1 hypothetical protein [Synechocystis salina LEGE 00041]